LLPDNVARDLRVIAEQLRAMDVHDTAVVAACRRIAEELGCLAGRLEDRVIGPDAADPTP